MKIAKHASGFKKEVARDVVLEVPERYDGYREQLLSKLTEIIECQESDLTKTARRREVRRILEAFGQQVATQTKRVEET